MPCCGKKLPSETREVKVDMLVYNREYGDVYVCEDKPEHAAESEVKADTAKNQQLAENRLAHPFGKILISCNACNAFEGVSRPF